MKYDDYGQAHVTESELCDLLYQRPDLDLKSITVDDPGRFNDSIKELFVDLAPLKQYVPYAIDIKDFDSMQQANWHMPEEYAKLDIAEWVLAKCSGEAELQRAGQELLMFQERDLFNLLRYMKYLVDTLRSKNVLWGVGRGSNVASFVLYLLGVHRINSLYYDLDPTEFLK